MSIDYAELHKFLEKRGIDADEQWWEEYKTKIEMLSTRADQPELTSNKQVKEELKSIEEKSGKLLHVLEELSDHALGEMILSDRDSTNDHIKSETHTEVSNGFDKLHKIKNHLECLEKSARNAADNIPKDSGGRRRAVWRQNFILNMASLWEKLSNNKATISYDAHNNLYSGPFMEFLKLSLQLAGFEYQSSNAVGKEAQRVLSKKD